MDLVDQVIETSTRYSRPIITHFWIVEYKDGTALPQFDPEDFHENEYWRALSESHDQWLAGEMPKKKDIIAIGWYPINEDLAMGIMKECGIPCLPVSDKSKRVIIEEDEEPYLMREVKYSYSGLGTQQTGPAKIAHKYKIGKNVGTPYEIIYIIEIT